jgi:sugar lactone lactonase YvrE
VTNPGAPGTETSKVWLVRPDGSKQVVDEGLKFSNGIALSPDQTLLYVADVRSHWVYSYQVQPDGTLAHKQRYYHLHQPDDANDAGADGMCVDREGRLYIATRLGVQVCDQAGRVNVILPVPSTRVTNLRFGGPEFGTLYVTAGDKVFKREMKSRGANPWQPPFKPAAPRL